MTPAEIAVGLVLYGNTLDEITRVVSSAREALRRYGCANSKILVCDNKGSTDLSVLEGEIDILVADRNLGFGAGHNALMKKAFAAGMDAYIGANPDGVFHPEAICHLVRLHRACGKRAMIEAQQFPNEHMKVYDPTSLETEWVSGACFLLPQAIFAATGGFDERIFLYCEDVDLSWMTLKHGFKLLHCPQALFYHDMSERDDDDVWRYALMFASGRYLGHKWGCDRFRDWCEAELRLLDGDAPVPDLSGVPRLPDPGHDADFEHRFSFAKMRS